MPLQMKRLWDDDADVPQDYEPNTMKNRVAAVIESLHLSRSDMLLHLELRIRMEQ